MSDGNNACTLCGKKFARRGHLLNHITVCRPCKYCGKRLTVQLDRHERTCNGRRRPLAPGNVTDHTESLEIIDSKQEPYAGVNVDDDDELAITVKESWQSIKTFCKCHTFQDVLNIRMWDPVDDDFETTLGDKVAAVWNSWPWSCKMNMSVGCVLTHKNDGRFRYFHSSSNNATLLERSKFVSRESDLDDVLDELTSMDLAQKATSLRPNTEWKLHALTNLTFYFTKLKGVGRVGAGDIVLPNRIRGSRSIVCLTRNKHTGRPYDDNLCFFRCLALLERCRCGEGRCGCVSVSERLVVKLYDAYKCCTGITCEPSDFPGVTLADLVTLERAFDVRITVFRLISAERADVIWSSKKRGGRPLNLNVYNNHFSFVKNVSAFARSFVCYGCETAFTRASSMNQHVCRFERITEMTFVNRDFCP